MGVFIFAATMIAFLVAAVISIAVGAIGIFLYIWRGRKSRQTKQAFWYILLGTITVGVVIINIIRFPQAPAGSNYSEWMNEWVIKAVVYALIPGVACLLGGMVSMFTEMIITKHKKADGL